MASFLYDNYCNLMLGNGVHTLPDLDTDLIKVTLVNGTTDYTESQTTHQDFADVTDYLNVTPQTLGNKDVGTTTPRVFDNTADITFTSVAIDGTKVVDGIVHFYDSTVASTSTLMTFHDGFSAVTPNGGDIVIQYHASGIFGL